MSTESQTTQFMKNVQGRSFRRRSEAYRWLRINHEMISQLAESYEASWTVIADEITKLGVVGAKGQKFSPNALYKIWRRVCRDLEKERQAARVQQRPAEPATSAREEPKRFNPSRLPANYRPDVEIKPQPSVPATASGPYQVPALIDVSNIPDVYTLSSGKQIVLTQKQKENLAKGRASAQRGLDYHDRYIIPQKRK